MTSYEEPSAGDPNVCLMMASVVLGQGAIHNMWKSQGQNKDEGTNNYTSSL